MLNSCHWSLRWGVLLYLFRRIQLTDAPRRPFPRQLRTSAHLQLVSARMVTSLATVTRDPSSTGLSRTSCELLVCCFVDIHLMSSFLRIQGGDFSMCTIITSFALRPTRYDLTSSWRWHRWKGNLRPILT
jgi:hypothetical protein